MASRTSAPLARTAARSALTISAPVRSPACSSRLRLAPPQRSSRRRPSSRLKATPSDASQATASGPPSVSPRTSAGRAARWPAAKVSSKCDPVESSSPIAAWMPPWARPVFPAPRADLVTTVTRAPAARALRTADIPAPPDPTTSTSARASLDLDTARA